MREKTVAPESPYRETQNTDIQRTDTTPTELTLSQRPIDDSRQTKHPQRTPPPDRHSPPL